MDFQQASSMMQFDNSPAESFVSTPGDDYSSLFAATTPSAAPSTMNPMEMMTPKSYSDERPSVGLSVVPEEETTPGDTTPGSQDKKTTKKRKSWGQVLPEPKTNLPPRKRAKTEDEKEQRRVERVLRNRRAAQSSRERKRLEVEALEQRNKELETLLINAQKANSILVEELKRFRRNSGSIRSSSPLAPLHDNPVTLSQELFSSQDGHKNESDQSGNSLIDDLLMSSTSSNPPNLTVNPASLSPELGPVPDAEQDQAKAPAVDAKPSEQTGTPSDLTQRPAEMLCDLQCQMSERLPQSFLASQTSMKPLLALSLQLRMMLLSASAILSACQRPLTQIAISSKAGFSLLPTPQLLTTIIWLVTIPRTSRTNRPSTYSTSTTSSTTKQTMSHLTLWQRATMPLRSTASTSRSSTLRLKSLRKILTSSPNLARPLMDATMEALRLVSEGRDYRVGTQQFEADVTRGEFAGEPSHLSSMSLPSKEVLLTLLWALKVEERRIQRRRNVALDPESGVPDQPIQKYVLKVAGLKRRSPETSGSYKRFRLA